MITKKNIYIHKRGLSTEIKNLGTTLLFAELVETF